MNRPRKLRQERSRALMILVGFMWFVGTVTASGDPDRFDYKVLATNRTSTMEKEMNQASPLGFRLAAVMGGETSFGGSEAVVIMQKGREGASGSYQYRLLATNRTSTMEKEMNQAAGDGFGYAGQTVFETAFGGKETVVIMERDTAAEARYEYKLLATNRTSTMQKELAREGENGFKLAGMTVSRTTFGGEELVSILQVEGDRATIWPFQGYHRPQRPGLPADPPTPVATRSPVMPTRQTAGTLPSTPLRRCCDRLPQTYQRV